MDQAASARDTARAFPTTDVLLAGGFVGGALFIVVSLAQALTRSGYEFSHHPLSLLSLGDMGWVQVANFALTGVLFVGCAVGMRRVLARDRGGTWGPRLVGLFGMSLIAGGLFLPDPAFGFPSGAPLGEPEQLSWHGIGHAIASPVGFVALVVSYFAFGRHFRRLGQGGWAVTGAVVGVAVLGLSMWPNIGADPAGRFVPLWLAMVLGFGWVSIVAIRLQRDPDEETTTTL